MPFKEIDQPNIIKIDEDLRLRKLNEEEWGLGLPWYQKKNVLYYSEGVTDKVYDMNIINRMYKYLSDIGELYFIEALEENKWIPIGDVTLSEENMPIVLGDEKYWGRSIGKKVISKLIERAREINLDKIYIPSIYKYNDRSRNLFTSLGFIKVSENEKEESFQLKL